ncbi:pseudouridine synthase [Trueperella bernardiae]|uniref:pseudouridine synthase n=1 Tax=Trueperella bernardiae TaxID=59561 RepID=UPI0025573E9C|nr:pseudouridine synthase [Trueperella bernardiae]WIM08400.1 pseudouridine synthase [Trueperella bernardiae]
MGRRPRSQRRSAYQRATRPALRGGINASPVVLPEREFATLGEWAAERFGAEGAGIFDGDAFYGFSVPACAADTYRPGTRLYIFRPVPDEPERPIVLDVVHRAERFIIVDKPHGIATIPRGSYVARSVTVAARRQFANDDVSAAHRLDAETAGLVLLTLDPRWRGPYQDMFAARQVSKVYRAVAPSIDLGALAGRAGVVEAGPGHAAALGGRGADGVVNVELHLTREPGEIAVRVGEGVPNARTLVAKERELTDGLALYELRPVTGRLHQLRATMSYLGAPIAGDPLYPRVMSLEETARRPFPTQLLAAGLEFSDPVDDEPVVVRTRRTLELLTR